MIWNTFLLLLQLSMMTLPVEGAKDYLFKNCEQAGFCSRNRHFSSQVSELGEKYLPKYRVDGSSIQLADSSILGNIIKSVNETSVNFPFQLDLLDNNNLRFRLNEETRELGNFVAKSDKVNKKRYDEASKWFFKDEPLFVGGETVQRTVSNEKIILEYGKGYSAEIDFSPFKITVFSNGVPAIIINERNFLNVEHLRKEDDNTVNLAPEESDFDMFHDSFKDSSKDSLPFGPESVAADISFPGFSHVYGIPEHADSLSLKETVGSNLPYRLYNVDIFEYDTDSRMPMYGSIPFMMAQKPGTTVGVFWVNGADTFIDIDKKDSVKTHWMSENGVLDVILMIGESPKEVSKSYGALTGYAELPQLLALGYHQCRWNYNDEDDVLDIVAKADEYQIPLDVVWLDIEYTDAKKYFTWNKDTFPHPDKMLAVMERTGRNLVAIIDPHLKVWYSVSEEVNKKKIAIKDSSNETFHGHCWPGESIWIDSFNPEAVDFWIDQYKLGSPFMGDAKNLYIWNDMNEPSFFDGPETTSPRDNLHYGGWEHRSVHNIYGMTFHESTYEALKLRSGKRPFVLTRSYTAGSQRTAAMWTGDNMSKWEYLKISIPMVLTSGVVGMPFAGADVGGFFGNPSKELLTRWYQTGIWYPFFRAHAHIDTRRREPWIVGEPYTSIIADAVKLRYTLLPVIYTSFYDASISGLPIMKPMFYESPDNDKSYDIEDQFFVGDSGLLVKPVTDEGADSVDIYLPDDEVYYSYSNYSSFKGEGYKTIMAPLNEIPILFKGGNIIARKDRYRRSSKLMANDPYTLLVALDTEGNSKGKLYVDDGESYDYQESGSLLAEFTFNGDVLSSEILQSSTHPFIRSLDIVNVEKVIILGLKDIQANEVSVKQAGKEWSAELLKGEKGEYVIRHPKVVINKSWSIDIAEKKAQQVHDEF